MPSITKAEKQEWVQGLRSGNYKQGIGRLHMLVDNEHVYCCLGVRCDLHYNHSWEGVKTISNIFSIRSCTAVLPYEISLAQERTSGAAKQYIRDMYGENHSGVNATQFEQTLASLNDDPCRKTKRRITFNEIADFIEQFLPTID